MQIPRSPISKRLKDLRAVRDISFAPGNVDYDEYMRGMANGIEVAWACMMSVEPNFAKAPQTESSAVSIDMKLIESESWDALCKAVGDDKEAPASQYLTTIAQIYNGGFQQVVDNDYMEEYNSTISFLRTIHDPKAQQLAHFLRDALPAMQKYGQIAGEANQAARHGEGEYDEAAVEAASEELNKAVDAAEDWIYDSANIDPVTNAILQVSEHRSTVSTESLAKRLFNA